MRGLSLVRFGAAIVLAAQCAVADLVSVDKTQWQLPRFDTNVLIVKEGDGGRPCFKLETKTPDGNQLIQHSLFYAADVARVVLSGRMKTKGVVNGPGPSETCRAMCVFRTLDGERNGAWPAAVEQTGTTAWKPFRKEYTAPPGTRVVDAWLGLFKSTGIGWFDGVDLVAYDADGKELKPVETPHEVHTDTTGWIGMDAGPDKTDRPLVVDFSTLMPSPAGKAGFVAAKDGHLAFADGSRARFWGSGIVNTWDPPKEQSPAYAAGLARAGINIVRLHGMDAQNANATIFDQTSDKTDRLDPAKMDRLDFMIAELKKRGVYIDLNLTTKRHYLPGDGVADADKLPQGGKQAALFDPKLIELQKDYARLLLTHVNPYTGLAYKDEPAIAVVEIINESSLNVLDFSGGLPPHYISELDDLLTQFCAARKLARPTGDIRNLIKKRDDTVEQFIQFTIARYYGDMHQFLVKDMGVKVPISGTQFTPSVGEMRVMATLDLIDHHNYWDHPSGGWDPMAIFTDKPMVKLTDKHNIQEELVPFRVKGKPYMVSEWNFGWPNDYVTEGPLLVGSYAGLNDWDAAMIFGSDGIDWQGPMHGTFDSGNKPHVMLPYATMAMAFYRGDVTPGPVLAADLKALSPGVNPNKLFTRDEMLTRQCVLDPQGSADDRKTVPPAATTQPTEARTADGQIAWQSGGTFMLNTPRTQALLGFTGGKRTTLGDVSITLQNDFGQVIVSSLSSDPIATAPRLLVCATARAENTGQAFRPFRAGLAKLGESPVLMEPVHATIELKRGGPMPTLHQLDWYGRRTDVTLPVEQGVDGGWQFGLGERPVGWFEVSFEQK